MIVGDQKPFETIKAMIAGYQKILILGCETCVAVCYAGGKKEAEVLASALRMAYRLDGQDKEISDAAVQRQCEYEYNDEVADQIKAADVVLSLACGIGVQTMNEQFPEKLTLPGLNTTCLGQPTVPGVWEERCQACGDCVLDVTGGICPIARCAKNLLDGPCGGSQNGKCEINPEIPCAWQLIYDRLQALDRLELMMEYHPPKNWSTSRDGGLRRSVRELLTE
jgi:ferredoxin